MDMPSAGYDVETAKHEAETISMRLIESKPPKPLTIGEWLCKRNGRVQEPPGYAEHAYARDNTCKRSRKHQYAPK